MGKWSGGGGCLGNLIDLQNYNIGHGIIGGNERNVMHGLTSNLSTRYNKLDESIYLFCCQHCGHSFKTDELRKMATYHGPTPTTRLRSNSKHFLTWSATAANHKFQKLSKHFVNNVSKLQSKFPFHHQHHHHHQQQNTSQQSHEHSHTSDQDEDSSDWEPPSMNNGLGRNFNNTNGSNNGNSSSSANLMANDSLLLNNNHNNNNTNNIPLSNSGVSVISSKCNNNNNNNSKITPNNSNSNNQVMHQSYNKELTTGIHTNLNEKSPFLVKNLLGVQVTNTFELRPVVVTPVNLTERQQLQQSTDIFNNSSSNNASLSTISLTGTTLPLNSPHWSRASSISNSNIGLFNSQTQCDSSSSNNNNNNNNTNDNIFGHHSNPQPHPLPPPPPHHQHLQQQHHLLLLPTESEEDTRKESCKKNHNNILPPFFSSRSSTGSNNSGSGTCNGSRSLSPVDGNQLTSSSTITPIPTNNHINNKLTVTIFEEEAELRHAPWFQAGIPREIALEVLKNEPIGSFIVRESTTKSGCFALSMRVPKEHQPMGIVHYLILKTGRGYKIKGFTKEFQSLVSLITHHSVMPELLPCPLSLHRYRPKYSSRRRVHSSDFVEPEKLIPFRKFTDF